MWAVYVFVPLAVLIVTLAVIKEVRRKGERERGEVAGRKIIDSWMGQKMAQDNLNIERDLKSRMNAIEENTRTRRQNPVVFTSKELADKTVSLFPSDAKKWNSHFKKIYEHYSSIDIAVEINDIIQLSEKIANMSIHFAIVYTFKGKVIVGNEVTLQYMRAENNFNLIDTIKHHARVLVDNGLLFSEKWNKLIVFYRHLVDTGGKPTKPLPSFFGVNQGGNKQAPPRPKEKPQAAKDPSKKHCPSCKLETSKDKFFCKHCGYEHGK